jgi:hypothetical protein
MLPSMAISWKLKCFTSSRPCSRHLTTPRSVISMNVFVLDTNVLSAIMGRRPVPEVAAWVCAQPEALLFTVSVCQAEILAGIEVLPDGLYAELFAARKHA